MSDEDNYDVDLDDLDDFDIDFDDDDDEGGVEGEDEEKNRALLSDYYGITLPEAPKDEPAPKSTKGITSSTSNQFKPGDRLDMNSRHFDAEAYVNRLLQHRTMKDLVDYDSEMRSSVRSLDSEMQMLVYENYNKFISATDMIRTMRDNVENMEEEMNKLSLNVEKISSSCNTLEDSLNPHREKVEKLSGINRLVKRLEFIFELPNRLKHSVELGANAQAVRYFTKASGVLQQYNHIASFKRIAEQSEEIISELKQTLHKSVRDVTLSALHQMENSSLLMQLGEKPEILLKDIFNTRRARMQQDIREVVEEVNNPPENSPRGKLSTKRKTNNLLEALDSRFLTVFEVFAESFRDTFIEPLSSNKQHSGTVSVCQNALTEFARELFDDYFGVTRKALLDRAEDLASSPSLDVEAGGLLDLTDISKPVTYGSSSNDSAASQAQINKANSPTVEGLTLALKNYYQNLMRAHTLVPRAGIDVRSEEIVQHVIRRSIECVFEQSEANIVLVLKAVFSELQSMESEAEKLEAIERMTHLAPRLRSILDVGISILLPILDTNAYLPRTVSVQSGYLAHTHFHHLLSSLGNVLLCGTLRRSDGPIFDSIPESDVEKQSVLVTLPHFYLVVSHVCLQLQSTEIPKSLEHLKKSFPLPKGKESTALSHEVPILIDRIQENTPLLLEQYVNIHGETLAEKMLSMVQYINLSGGDFLENSDPDALSTMVSEYTDVIARELSSVFPSSTASGSNTNSQMRRRSRDRGDVGAMRQNGSFRGTDVRSSSRERNLKRDMERLFTQKVQIYGPIKRNRASPVCGVLKIAFKAYLEYIRSLSVLSLRGHKQVETDVYGMKSDIPFFLPADDISALEYLLDESLSSASDRCTKLNVVT